MVNEWSCADFFLCLMVCVPVLREARCPIPICQLTGSRWEYWQAMLVRMAQIGLHASLSQSRSASSDSAGEIFS